MYIYVMYAYVCVYSSVYESAKLRALRAKNVLACQRALRAYVLTCQRASRAPVPTCLACLRVHLPT